MDRKTIVELLKDGMQYPPGKHRFWVSRCFEITVRTDKEVVELDEYESFATEGDSRPGAMKPEINGCKEMFHVGRSILHLKDGRVLEESGDGWSGDSVKKS